MKNWKDALIYPTATLHAAIQCINNSGCKIALVVEENLKLLGTVSDGDIRRALLSGVDLLCPVIDVMEKKPECVFSNQPRVSILLKMRELNLYQMPIIEKDGKVIGLEIITDFNGRSKRTEWVVIMAGGLGTRLGKLTENIPKPMLTVGDKPILETILLRYIELGFSNFYMALNYKGEQIESYFGDGSGYDVNIRYLRESKKLGTAGALSLIKQKPQDPFIVTNADLLNTANYSKLLDGHIKSKADATMGVRNFEMQVPFGVLNVSKNAIISIEEKPTKNFLISAGINCFSPNVLDLIPYNEYLDIPELFNLIIKNKKFASYAPIEGYWLDIGQHNDFEKAKFDFNELFK